MSDVDRADGSQKSVSGCWCSCIFPAQKRGGTYHWFAPTITNYAIADIHNGYKGHGTSVSTNPAALLGAIRSSGDDGTSAEGHFGPTTYVANDGAVFEAGVTPYLQGQSKYGGRFPIHVVEYLKTIQERRRSGKEGEVSVEEFDDTDPD